MNVQPLFDRVAIKPAESKERTKGGIIIPDNAKEKPTIGTVVAVGKGRVTPEGKVIAVGVKPGDVVYYPQYSGVTIKEGDESLVLLREDDLLAVDTGRK